LKSPGYALGSEAYSLSTHNMPLCVACWVKKNRYLLQLYIKTIIRIKNKKRESANSIHIFVANKSLFFPVSSDLSSIVVATVD